MRHEWTRITRLFGGLFLYAVGIVMTIHAGLGLSPWDVFHHGVSLRMGISMGVANIGVAAVIVGVSVLVRERVGLGTLCNMIFIGLFLDGLMASGWIPVLRGGVAGFAMLVGGLFVIAFASVVYIGAAYAAGPRDSLMVMLSRRTGYSAGACRGIVELAVCLSGWALGGYAGLGTVAYAFGIGFAVQLVFGLLRFKPTLVRQESFGETYARWCARR